MDSRAGSNQGSPYIRGDIALVPPSPELNPSSHYGSVLDFQGSPHLLDNSGSFNNSPFSRHSELSFVTAENGDISFDILSDNEGLANFGPGTLQGAGDDFDYNPLEFDGPHSGSSLMIYADNDYMSPPANFGSPSPDQQQHRSGSVPFDYSSPASTNNDDGNDRRSRASSVSSAHRGQQQQQNFYHHSPRLEVAQSFENMTVRSPNWGVQGLPSTQAPQQQDQQHKAPSPPRLVMPDGPPVINAPDGDMDGGPQLHIVPATPIGIVGQSGMGAHYQNPLESLNQGSDIGATQQQQTWVPSNASEASGSRQASPFRFPARLPDDASNNRHSDFLGSVNNNTNAPFLFPQQQRHRSKSDNALEPPAWDANFVQQQLQQQGDDNSALGLDIESAGNLDDNGMNTASSTSSVNPNSSASYTMQTFQFGGGAGASFRLAIPRTSGVSVEPSRRMDSRGLDIGKAALKIYVVYSTPAFNFPLNNNSNNTNSLYPTAQLTAITLATGIH
ncbi:hypothetical protein NMY22_g1416 [Coprinellus aureogranulatus]|nr:hypothetical protein NMY22_g1416 [Coprinellus aureogranulatus]